MRFRSQIINTLAIQGFGAIAILSIQLYLGATVGPSQQGTFSIVKTEIEFAAALCMCGMPQALFYFSSLNKVHSRQIFAITVALAGLTLFLSLIYSATAHSAYPTIYIYLFSLASAAVVVNAMTRILVLAHSTISKFNKATALPQILLLMLVLLVVSLTNNLEAWQVALIYFLAYGVSSLAAIPTFRHSQSWASLKQRISFVQIFKYGAASWVCAAAYGASSVMWLRYIEGSLGISSVGIFSMGLVVVAIIMTPVNYSLPILFKQWMSGPPSKRFFRAALFAVCIFVLVLTPIISLATSYLTIPLLSAYSELFQLKWALTGAAISEILLRVVGVASNAFGKPWHAGMAEIVRALSLSGSFFMIKDPSLLIVTYAWAMSSILAAIYIMAAAYNHTIAREST